MTPLNSAVAVILRLKATIAKSETLIARSETTIRKSNHAMEMSSKTILNIRKPKPLFDRELAVCGEIQIDPQNTAPPA
jgi:hypothetical protein